MAEGQRVVVVRREPREKGWGIKVDDIAWPAIIGGGLIVAAIYKDQIAELINKGVDEIPALKKFLESINIPIYPIPKIPPIVPPVNQPPPPPTSAGTIFDSNRHWVGKAGQTVTKFGNIGPNGKGFHAEASGNPRIRFVTPTEYELQGSGSGIHPRIYGAVNNYNARLELDFKFQSGSVENISFKIRNRHQMGGACSNRVGGFGAHFSRTEGGFQIEKCHNIHEPKINKRLPQTLSNGTYYRAAFTVQDTSQGILQILSLNGQEVIRSVYKGNYAPYRDKSSFDRHSEFWIRYNGGSGAIRFKNVRVIALGSSNLAYAYPIEQRLTIA